jgi:hypothetical protein
MEQGEGRGVLLEGIFGIIKIIVVGVVKLKINKI